MAQTYTSGGVTLRIDSLARREHDFIEDGQKVGKLSINRSTNEVEIDLIDNEETTLESISDCYNQFIKKNKKYRNYELRIHYPRGCKFSAYAIKQDVESPVKLATKKQINQLDENKIPYYNYLAPSKGLSKIHGKNKECLTGNLIFELEKPDDLEDIIIVNDKLSSSTDIFLSFQKLSDYDNNTYVKMPSIKQFNNKNIPPTELIVREHSFIISNNKHKIPLDLSKIDTDVYKEIVFSYSFDRDTFKKTLETINNTPDIVLHKNSINGLGIKTSHKGEISYFGNHYIHYDGKELLNEFKKEVKPSDNLNNSLK